MIASGQPVELFDLVDLVEVISGDRCSPVVAMATIDRVRIDKQSGVINRSTIGRFIGGIRIRIRKRSAWSIIVCCDGAGSRPASLFVTIGYLLPSLWPWCRITPT